MDIHQRMVFLMEKTVKPYFKAMILSLKNYENILKFNFLIFGQILSNRSTATLFSAYLKSGS